MIESSMKIIGGGGTPGMNNNKPKPASAPVAESDGPARAPAPPGMGTQVDKTA